MGFIRDLTGKTGAEAATKAAAMQTGFGREALQLQQQAAQQAMGLFQPLTAQAQAAIPQFMQAATQPQSVLQDPLFQGLADEAQRRVFNIQAARGKLGSGQTAQDLSRSLMGVGSQLQQQRLGNIQAAAQMGQSLLAQQGNLITGQAAQQAQGLQNLGNVQAAGLVGAAGAKARGAQGIMGAIAQGAGAYFGAG